MVANGAVSPGMVIAGLVISLMKSPPSILS